MIITLFLFSYTGIDDEKQIFLIFPPINKSDSVDVVTVPFDNEQDFHDFCEIHDGNIIDHNNTVTYKTIEKNDGIYIFNSNIYKPYYNNIYCSKINNKIFQLQAAVAIKTYMNKKSCIYPSVEFTDHITYKTIMKIDPIVHVYSENTLYLINAVYAPDVSDVYTLTDNVSKLQYLNKIHNKFPTLPNIVPVLAGQKWSRAAIQATTTAQQWRVTHSTAASYQVIRSLHTIIHRVVG